MASAISIGLLSYPLFSLMTNGTGLALVVPLQILFGILLALYSGAGPAAISEIFPTHLRSTWMTSGYALAGNILFVAGLAAGGAGAYFLWRDHKSRATIVPAPSEHGAAVVVRGTW